MKRAKSIYLKISGNVDEIGTERYFITITCFVATIFLLTLCMVHVIMNLKPIAVLYAGGSAAVIGGLYLLVRFGSCLYFPKLFLSLFGLIMLDITWYSKYLSNGPVLFFILIFGALILWVWEGKSLAILLGIYFLNILVLYLIDSNAPKELFLYSDPEARSLDIFLSFTLYSTLMIFLLYVVKQDFIRQKNNAVKSDRLKSAFLANMSHEIRTPMNAIVGFSALLKDWGNPEKRDKYINYIQSYSEHLLRLINDIIDLSKIEASEMKIKYSSFSVLQVFKELKEIHTIEIKNRDKKNVQLDFKLSSESIKIYSDSFRIKQILSNLINNAVKFTEKGEILFSCEKKNSDWLFCVSDTGVGIPDKDQEEIFNHFTSFNYKGLNTEGTGIGLSIVKKLLHLLQGKIWFNSKVGIGTNIYFTIPVNPG